jgi:hypothetical protein
MVNIVSHYEVDEEVVVVIVDHKMRLLLLDTFVRSYIRLTIANDHLPNMLVFHGTVRSVSIPLC